MEYKLRRKPDEVLEMTTRAVRYARDRCAEVEFSPEDATRSDIDFLCQVVDRAVAAGASIINITDTVGYSTPAEIENMIGTIRNRVANIDKAVISIHCHNDLGLAVANTISGLRAGARQAELTINGIGERAGNAALEELVMALAVRKDFYQFECGIDTRQINRTSRMLSTIIGFPIARNKAIVGENAFAHEAGIHQHGMLANRQTYEIMTPESVGRGESKIVLGRHSGMHGFRSRLEELSIQLQESEIQTVYNEFLNIADRKREVFDEDIIALVGDQLGKKAFGFQLLSYSCVTASGSEPRANVVIDANGERKEGDATGDGPVNAIFSAINQALDLECRLEEFTVHALTPGTESMGEVTVTLNIDNHVCGGHGASTDILEAGAKAYVHAVGRARRMQSELKP